MKIAVEMMKALQTGGIFGSLAIPTLAASLRGRNPEQISFISLEVVSLSIAFGSSLYLAVMGEWRRARNGLILMVVLLVVVAGLSAPLVIR